jgi:hypothetical protein
MPSADCCWTVREALASLSQFPWHATSQGIPQLSRGKSQSRPRIDAGFTKQPLSGWRTLWSRAHSSQNCHASYPVRIPRPARSFHASFRPHLAVTPLRFPCPSPPPGWTEDFHLQALRHARHTRGRSPFAAHTETLWVLPKPQAGGNTVPGRAGGCPTGPPTDPDVTD